MPAAVANERQAHVGPPQADRVGVASVAGGAAVGPASPRGCCIEDEPALLDWLRMMREHRPPPAGLAGEGGVACGARSALCRCSRAAACRRLVHGLTGRYCHGVPSQPNRSRASKRKRRLRLTDRLVDESLMQAALLELLAGADRAFFCVTRGRVDSETGQTQDAAVVIDRTEMNDAAGNLARSLRRCRKIVLVATWPDNGSMSVNLTARTFEVLSRTDGVDDGLLKFAATLKEGGRSRFVMPGTALLLALWPVPILFVAYIVATVTDPAYRAYSLGDIQTRPPEPKIPWMDTVGTISVVTWPPALVVALAIVSIRALSGGLRLWPEYLSQVRAMSIFYRLRTESVRGDSWRTIFVGIVIGFGSALLSVWFTR